jgi:hypothetical protein
MASLIITGKVLGKRALIVYITSIIFSALLFAHAIDLLLPQEWFNQVLTTSQHHHHHHDDLLGMLSTIAMLGLLIHAAVLKLRHRGHHHG